MDTYIDTELTSELIDTKCPLCKDTYLLIDEKEIPDKKRFSSCPKCDPDGFSKEEIK